MHRTMIVAATLSLGMAIGAHADTRMSFSTQQGDASLFSIKGDRIRMEGGENENAVTLYDASENRLTIIDPSEQSYYRMDAESMQQQSQRMSEQMEQVRKQMEQQMENMPEEQREQMRQQMEQMMPDNQAGQEEPADLRIERSGERSRVAGIECEHVTVHGDGKPIHRACVASTDSIGMSSSDISTLKSLFGMLDDMAAGFGGQSAGAHAPGLIVDELDGLPIQAKDLESDATWTLQDVQSDDLDAADFEIPAGYQKIDPFSAGQAQ